ncbi:MAG: hypothetical protein E7262_04955 [Lachnospiraceae bacterium]|nr:hypothetical protein [Lachnospiraceae bacterium]
MADTNRESSLKSRDRAILKVAVAVVLAVVCYLIGSSLQTETNKLKTENGELTQRVLKLEAAERNKPQLQKDLKKMNTDTEYILKKFPSNHSLEKTIRFVCDLWKDKYSFGLTEMSYRDNGVFYTFQDEKGKEDESLGKISSATVTARYSSDYKGFKLLMDLFNQEIPTRVSINNITIAPGETISSVEGEITFTVYYGATVRPYEEPKFDVDLGRDNLFN